MNEKIRTQQPYRPHTEEAPVGVLDQAEEPERNVQVIYGAGAQTLPLAGLDISQARELVQGIFSLDADTRTLVNGRPARAGYRIVAGDVVEFVHHAGEKGARHGPAHRNRRG